MQALSRLSPQADAKPLVTFAFGERKKITIACKKAGSCVVSTVDKIGKSRTEAKQLIHMCFDGTLCLLTSTAGLVVLFMCFYGMCVSAHMHTYVHTYTFHLHMSSDTWGGTLRGSLHLNYYCQEGRTI